MAQEVTRRLVLAAAAAALPALAGGCKGVGALGTPPKPTADVIVVVDAIAVERGLITHYAAVLGAVPSVAATLRPLLSQHHDHLALLRARLVIPRGRPAPSPSPTPRGKAPVPGTAASALAYLGDAEDAASAALLAHLGTAPPSLAQLLASISASEATHAMLLRGHGRLR